MSSNPFGQARQLIQLAEDQKLSEGDVQKLFRSPCLSTLFKAARYLDLPQVDQAAYRAVLGYDDRDEFEVTTGLYGFTSTLAAELRAKGCAVHHLIDDRMFPLYRHTSMQVRVKLVDPGKTESFKAALECLGAKYLWQPSYEQALCFALTYVVSKRMAQEQCYILLPHAPVRDDMRFNRVLALVYNFPHWKLDLGYADTIPAHDVLVAGVVPV